MASSTDPSQPSPITSAPPAATGIQTPSGIPASAEAPSVVLPPPPRMPPIDAAKLLRQRGWLDAVLVVLVLLFAFFVASFSATNPDFFGQAATGRLLLHGEYRFGVDPFVYSAEESDYFVNHSWLFALLMYGLYQIPPLGGAAVVVIFKALLIVALAAILLRIGRRPGQSSWIPAACTALALLALSPRLYLQSTCLSYFFLGLTLWLLTAVGRGRTRLLWLLPPLFAVWVNCDSWFFLGPLTVALYLAGELLQQRWNSFSFGRDSKWSAVALPFESRPNENQRELRTLGLVLAIGVAACLVNPHHIHAFTLPPEFGLTPAGDLIEHDPQFYAFFLSPLRKDYYHPYLGLNTAGLAYWPLLLLGAASFVLVFGSAPWWRLLVWMGFALMSLYNVRAIPFFAIVAGPIMALNWQDYAVQLLSRAPPLTTRWRNWALGGRVLSVLLGLALLMLAAPGWLQSQPKFRQLGWSVLVDPSLKAMAETIHDWRQSGRLGRDEPNWFNMHYEVAYYLAYFAPGERVYLDQAIPQFRRAAEDYHAIRQGLEQMWRQPSDADGEARGGIMDVWQILHDRHVRYWIFDDRVFQSLGMNNPEKIARAVLFSSPKEWVLCHLKGHIAIFAWRDPKQPEGPDPSAGLALDLKREAFGRNSEPAPRRGPELAPPRGWGETVLDVWWPAVPKHSIDADSAALYEVRYVAVDMQEQIAQHTRAWRGGIAAGVVAGLPSQGPVPNNLLALNWCWTYNDLFPRESGGAVRRPRPSDGLAMTAWDTYLNGQFFETPSLHLEVRALRRALLANPEDGPSWFRLGQSYQHLRDLPHERNLRAAEPLLAAIRSTQMAGAYQNCLRLQVDDDKAAQAHEALFDVYERLGYVDTAVHHLREALNKRTAAGPQPNMSPTQHNQILDKMSTKLTQLDAELERRSNRYDLNAASKTGMEKVKVALQEGLTETALAALEQADEPNANNPAEMFLFKQVTGIALDLGRLDTARLLLKDLEGKPANPEDLNLYLRLAAGRGDYAEADQFLADALRHAWQPPPGQPQIGDPALVAKYAIARVLLADALPATGALRVPFAYQGLSFHFWVRRWRLEAIVNGLIDAQQQAEWHLIRGWLALEAGHCVEARKQFQTVREMAVPGEKWVPEVNRENAWLDSKSEIQRVQQLVLRHNILYALSGHYLNWLVEEE